MSDISIWYKPGAPKSGPRRGLVIVRARSTVFRRAGEVFLFGTAPKTGFYAATASVERLDPVRLKEAGYRVVGVVERWQDGRIIWDSAAFWQPQRRAA